MNHIITADPDTRAATENPTYFGWLNTLLSDAGLRDFANRDRAKDIRVTAVTLASYGRYGVGCWPSLDKLSGQTGFSERTLRTHLAELVERGWFTATKRKGKTTHYSISTPATTAEVPRPRQLGLPHTPATQVADDQVIDQVKEEDQVKNPGNSVAEGLGPGQEEKDDVTKDSEPSLPAMVGVSWCSHCDQPYTEKFSAENDYDGQHDWVCRTCGGVEVDHYQDSRGSLVAYCMSCDPGYQDVYDQAIDDWRAWNRSRNG